MKSLSFALLALSFTAPAFASEYWDDCSNADRSVKVTHGDLYVNGEAVAGLTGR